MLLGLRVASGGGMVRKWKWSLRTYIVVQQNRCCLRKVVRMRRALGLGLRARA